MEIKVSLKKVKSPLVRKVTEISDEKIYSCYQCGKCSAGCPFADQMDLLPNQVIRFVQLGMEEVLDCKTIWVCSACFTCRVGCPKGIDIANLNEALRLLHLRRNQDHLKLGKLPREELLKLPQIALISSLRKYTA